MNEDYCRKKKERKKEREGKKEGKEREKERKRVSEIYISIYALIVIQPYHRSKKIGVSFISRHFHEMKLLKA